MTLRSFHLAAWPLLALAIAPAYGAPAALATECVTDPAALNSTAAEPYSGYEPTGYKGSLERNEPWFQAVQPLTQAEGSQRFVFKRLPKADRTEYESIEPVSLGGKSTGFAAYRQGCGVLMDGNGRSLGVAPFTSVEEDYSDANAPKGTSRLVLRRSSASAADSVGYVMFKHGKKIAASRRLYATQFSAHEVKPAGSLPAYLRVVAASDNAIGLLNLHTLQETIPPTWLGIGALADTSAVKNGKPRQTFLTALGPDGLHLFTEDGTPATLPRFDRVSMIYDWIPAAPGQKEPSPAILEIVDAQARECRLYSTRMEPLLPQAQTMQTSGYCVTKNSDQSAFFAYSRDGMTQIYRKSVQKGAPVMTRTASDISGDLVFAFKTGVSILKDTHAASAPYRIVNAQGQELPGGPYTQFTNLGCGMVRLKQDSEWKSVSERGELSSKLTYPFSC
ncbi:hypothetical protein RAS12_27355 [Achromobacter seleniivolatilans]|uniref:Phytase-like domain-containing protein n=1 Tax=Achromobacter seleniivolatilans TaxID=3047478 RepID=A0ABY9LZV5_9BURK|nr:hypothetical protein [Achromobacter sp. R39]WMD20281.1 hypothetical protein RAS12_27355 [Achromobacter sp. R39]